MIIAKWTISIAILNYQRIEHIGLLVLSKILGAEELPACWKHWLENVGSRWRKTQKIVHTTCKLLFEVYLATVMALNSSYKCDYNDRTP